LGGGVALGGGVGGRCGVLGGGGVVGRRGVGGGTVFRRRVGRRRDGLVRLCRRGGGCRRGLALRVLLAAAAAIAEQLAKSDLEAQREQVELRGERARVGRDARSAGATIGAWPQRTLLELLAAGLGDLAVLLEDVHVPDREVDALVPARE